MQKKGFTLIELLVTILIIALLGGVGIVSFSSVFNIGKDRYYRTLESSVLLAGNDYFLDHRDELPNENRLSEVSLANLIEGKYIEPIKDSNGNLCTDGKVYAYRENNKYSYEACLICGDDYQSRGKYCNGDLVNTILVTAVTKTTNQPRNVTLSYNSVEPAIRENVLTTFSMDDITIDVSKYDVINEKNKNKVLCPMSGNICTAEISESGTYKVIAYDENDKQIANRYINVRIITIDDGHITLSDRSVDVNYGTSSKSFTITDHHGGNLSVSDDNSQATCSVDGLTVTCSSLGTLSAGTSINISVTSSETNEYTEATAYYTINIVKKPLTITAKAQTIASGSEIATGVAKVTTSGLVSGDELTSITLTASRTSAGVGTITPSKAKTTKGIANYDVTYKKGTLTIYNTKTGTIEGKSASGTVKFTGVNTIVSSSVNDGSVACTLSGTTATCTVTGMTKKTASTDATCVIATGYDEAFYYNNNCYYRENNWGTPSFTGNSWMCGNKTNPLKGSTNHCPNSSEYCGASNCWNAIKYTFYADPTHPSNVQYKCKCWGITSTRNYYSSTVTLKYY